jgi:lipopolysaccharide exporter
MTESEEIVELNLPDSAQRSSGFAADILKLASGATFAQVLTGLLAPLLARLFAPDAFGIAAVFLAITSVVGVVSCLRYELAIMLPKQDEEAANLLAVSLFFVLLVTGLSAVAVALGHGWIIRLLNTPGLSPYLWLVPLAVLANGTFLALNYWNSRTKRFGRLSIAQVFQSLTSNGSQLGLGFAGHVQAGTLITTRVLGAVIVTGVLGGQILRDDGHLLRRSFSWRNALFGLRRHYKFPLYSTWTGLLNNLSWQVPVVILAIFFSPTIVGFYSLGNRVVRLPLILIGSAIAQVFFQRAAEAHLEGKLSMTVEALFQRLVSLGIFPILLLTVTGRELFVTFFGQRWAEAGVYTQILSIYVFFNFLAAPLSQLFSVLEKQEAALVTNVALFLSRFVALWIGGQTGDIRRTLYLFTASGVLVYGGYSLWLVTSAGVSVRSWGTILLRWLLPSGAILVIGWLICRSFELRSWGLLAVYGASAVVYYVWLLANDAQLSKLTRELCAYLQRGV